MKHFHRNTWHLGDNWENTDHVFGAPDSDKNVELKERDLAASFEISDDKHQGMGEEEEESESLSLPLHRHTHDVQVDSRKPKRAGR